MDFIQQTIADTVDWLWVEENQQPTLIFIAILVLVGGLLLRIFGVFRWFSGLFKQKPGTQPPAQQPMPTLPFDPDEPVITMKRSVFEAELETRATEVEAALATASDDERTRLEGQRAEIANRLADVEGAEGAQGKNSQT